VGDTAGTCRAIANHQAFAEPCRHIIIKIINANSSFDTHLLNFPSICHLLCLAKAASLSPSTL
jgi:hypothetical protein